MGISKRPLNTQVILILILAVLILCLWVGSSAEGQHRRPNECTPTLQAWLPLVVCNSDPLVTPSAAPTCRPTPTAQRPTPTPPCALYYRGRSLAVQVTVSRKGE